MIPRFRPDIGWPELVAALRVDQAGDIERFETAFAAEMGQRHAVSFPYGRTGLMLLLEALGLRDREVICPAYTCVVVPHAVVLSGNRPVFIDSQAVDCNMDLDLAEAAIGPQTGALIATSIFGHPVDLDRLDALASRHPGLVIIQDCAHSFAAEWRGRPVQQAGRAAIFGLNISKMATSIFGGMVSTDDAELAAHLRVQRSRRVQLPTATKGLARRAYLLATRAAFQPLIYGLVRRLERGGWLDRFSRYYDEGRIELPADALMGLTPVEARVGVVQIAKYRAMVEARRRWATFYREAMAAWPEIRFPDIADGATWSHIVVEVADRDRLVRAAEARGIQLGVVIDYNIPEMAAYASGGNEAARWPVAARFARHLINLPVSGVFSRAQAERCVVVLAACLREMA